MSTWIISLRRWHWNSTQHTSVNVTDDLTTQGTFLKDITEFQWIFMEGLRVDK